MAIGEARMLKKCQILLPDWLEEHVKYLALKYDLSFSEIIRGEMCYTTLSAITHLHPEYKSNLSPEKIMELFQEHDYEESEKTEIYRIMTDIYSETRKAIEYWKEKKSTKKF